MKNVVSCLFIALVVLGLSSCQKGLSFPPDTTVNTDTLLQKLVLVDSLNPMQGILNIDYTYDDQQRVTKIKYYDVDSVNGVAYITLYDSTTFDYQNNDRLPYKSKGYSRLLQSLEVETYHRYTISNGRNLLTVDSVPLGDGISYAGRTLLYTDKIIARSEFWITGSLVDDFNDTFYLTGRNIVRAAFASAPGIAGLYFENTFDTRINPLSKLNIAPVLAIDGEMAYDRMVLMTPGYCPNNIIGRRSSFTFPMTDVTNQAYNFTYTRDGLPIQCRFESNKETARKLYLKYFYASK
jgi:hypothetical protein